MVTPAEIRFCTRPVASPAAARAEVAALEAERATIPFGLAPAPGYDPNDEDAPLVCVGACTEAGVARIAAINQRIANLNRYVAQQEGRW